MIAVTRKTAIAALCLALAAAPAFGAEKRKGNTKAPTIVMTKKVISGGANTGVVGTFATTAVPLTAGECKGLGGKVTGSEFCSSLNQQACATVDQHGTIRVACIDEVSE